MNDMKGQIKEVTKKYFGYTYPYQYFLSCRNYNIKKDRYCLLKSDEITERRVVYLRKKKKKEQFGNILKRVQINIRAGARFQHWIDTGLDVVNLDSMIDNLPPNYEIVISSSINELIEKNKMYGGNVGKCNVECLQYVSGYIDRIVLEIQKELDKEIEKSGCNEIARERILRNLEYFCRMKTSCAESAEEALQRIIFWSSIFWQTKHRLVGIGRLDRLLNQFDVIGEEDAIQLLTDFFEEMHRYYAYKSNSVALGDTGQIIIIGGVDATGNYCCNAWTYLIIKTLIRHRLPDPKILLRVSSCMPAPLLELALDCISTGVGCPLLSNDDVVIAALEQFGYSHEDACDYVTSACWEPLAYGKSLEKNNMRDLNYAQAVVDMYMDVRFEQLQNFDEVKLLYMEKIESIFKNILKELDKVRWEADPLMSIFTEGCLDSGRDISDGGAKYNDYGILTVGLANAVDSLLNIRAVVFEQKKYSLYQLKMACQNNYINEKIRDILTERKYFSKDETEVFELIKEIEDRIDIIGMQYRNKFGGKLKWGYSSSNYEELGKITAATLDGRKSGEPLAVHISPAKGCGYTELINFAGQLDYNGNHSNGNVIDFFIAPAFIQKNRDKFLHFLKSAIKIGFFQMQMNVVDSKTLIEAKKYPEKFPNLIVRVWGFSAYFKDLPECYQKLLIHRAMENEGLI